MISTEQLHTWSMELDEGRIHWHGEMRELIAEVLRNACLESRLQALRTEFDATIENLVQTRRERDYLARQCERLDDYQRDEKYWRNLAWEACLG